MKRKSCTGCKVPSMFRLRALAIGFVAFAVATLLAAPPDARAQDAGWAFTSIDYPGAIATESNDMAAGIFVGDYTDTSNKVHGFAETYKGIFTRLDYPGAISTYAWGVNTSKQIVGYYVDSANNSHGFMFTSPHTFQSLDYPGGTGTFAYGINDSGEIVGTWFDTSLNQHGFTLVGGTYTSFDLPGSTGTNPVGVSNAGTIVGYFFDLSNIQHGFQLVGGINGTFTQVDYPGSSYTSVDRMKDTPVLYGLYAEAAGVIHGFGASGTQFVTIDYPGATETRVRGMEEGSSLIVGRWTDKNGAVHGFTAAPQISKVSPNWGRVGQTLQATISASQTHFLQGSTVASFGAGISVGGAAAGQPGPVTVNSPTQATALLAISATASPGSQTVTVTTGSAQASLVNGFTIFPAVPTLTILHTFSGSSDGSRPSAPVVIGTGGVLYGTTTELGNGLGTVFSLTPPATQGGSWTETTLHQFVGPPGDGTSSYAGLLIGAGGVLYGTTYLGGDGTGCFGSCGTVFSLTPPISQGGSWTESLPYQFSGLPGDGFYPVAGLLKDSKGVLYGTTLYSNYNGTSNRYGTVFSLTPPATQGGSWTETILHEFSGPPGDGANPYAALVMDGKGVLYGTTDVGGTSVACASSGCGTVFSLTPPATQGGSWTETILHNFAGGTDGAYVNADVVIGGGGVLYGTTGDGGTSNHGIVFSLTPPATQGGSWTEAILHNFSGSGGDGAGPEGGLVIGGGGVLYGTTDIGGTSNQGTVFSLKPPASRRGLWTETVLYSFTGTSGDGSNPQAGLVIDSNGLLYGTTLYGGSSSQNGIVFSLTP